MTERPDGYFLYHLHSDYSLLDSCTDFKEYADLVKAAGGTAIASTEHGLPRGWVSKKLYCDSIGLKFVHGVEIYLTEQLEEKVRDNYHTVLLAKNEAGVFELNKLVTLSSRGDHFYYTNRITFQEFLGISDNIIKTSACLASPLWHLSMDNPWYERLLAHYDYLEVQPHIYPEQVDFNRRLAKLSRQYGIPLIAGTDTHSSSPYMAECRKILLAAKHKSYGNEDTFDLSYKTLDALIDMFQRQRALSEEEFLQAIANSNAVAESCETFELDRSNKYPLLYGSREKDAEIFEQRVWSGLDEKLAAGIIPAEQESAYREALAEELQVFDKLDMSGFMLSMHELLRWCKEQGMAIGTARGSVGGSRAAYVTDIIDMNPEQWHTVFSRFANADRVSAGDIDTDVVIDDRPQIFQHVIDRFGADKTARVAAYGTLVDKSVIDTVCRALALQAPEGDKRYSLDAAKQIKEEYIENPEAAKKKYPDVFRYFDGLVGTRVSQSVHPAGMVISPITLDDHYGTFQKDGETCLMLDMEEAHDVGAIKYDFLALKTVKVIRDACQYAGIEYLQTHNIDFNDEAVWDDMVRAPYGNFQFEGDYAFKMMRKFKPRSVEDLSLITAALRPSGASYRDELLERKTHKNVSPMIDKLLEKNNGFLVYQEDVSKFLQDVCGLSGSAADTIRRAIADKKEDKIDEALPEIIEGYCSKSTQPHEVAEQEVKEFLQILKDASRYMFGYNHACAYSILTYYCAYMRYYYPIEFTTSFLNNAQNEDDITNGAELARMYGIRISNPKWGVSKGNFFFDREARTIYKGLASLKNMGTDVSEELYQFSQRHHYKSFMELLFGLTEETKLDSRQLDLLVKIDFFSEFGNQRELLRMIDMFNLFKKGAAKKLKRETVDGTPLEPIVRKYATDKTKAGEEAKSYTLLDVRAILLEVEQYIMGCGMKDLSDVVKVRNAFDIMGYAGYTSGREEDRPKLFVVRMFPLYRKKDGKQFGYSFITRSIGSGKESRFTVFNEVYKKLPVREGDIILCKSYTREGQYFTLRAYDMVV